MKDECTKYICHECIGDQGVRVETLTHQPTETYGLRDKVE